MSQDNTRDFPRDPRRPRRSMPPTGNTFDSSSSRDHDFRFILPPQESKIFDQDAPENLDTEESNFQGVDLTNNQENTAHKTISETQATPNWLVFDVGNDDIFLPISKSDQKGLETIQPQVDSPSIRIWTFKKTNSLNVHGFLCPKVPGSCEDAPPIFVTPTTASLRPTSLGVLDGMGGAGAGVAKFETPRLSISTSEALLASRIVRLAVIRALTAEVETTCNGLAESIKVILKKTEDDLRLAEKTRIRGTVIKRLPTTLVVSQIHDHSTISGTKIETWWAGDSRAFLVTPEDGLTLLTRDHVQIDDPLEQLRSDPPIENVVNMSTDFYLDENSIMVKGPFLLLLATDGVFGYLPTPGFLELGLIESLIDAQKGIAKSFANFCTTYAADDVSAVLFIRGFSDDADMRSLFSSRLDMLRKRYSLLTSMTNDDPNRNAEVERLWAIERPSYLRLSKVTHV